MRRLAAITLLCAAPAAATPVAPSAAAAPAAPAPAAPPAVFAGLFRDGARWTFKADLVHRFYDDQPRREVSHGEIACAMAGVRAITGGWLGELTCTGIDQADRVSGTYVATAAGLWRVDAPIDDAKALDPARLLIAASPRAGRREIKATDDEDGGDIYVVRRHAGAWCFSHTSYGGDEAGFTLCLVAGKGLAGGSGFSAGGASYDLFFGAVPRS
jgi:hypothetical protein